MRCLQRKLLRSSDFIIFGTASGSFNQRVRQLAMASTKVLIGCPVHSLERSSFVLLPFLPDEGVCSSLVHCYEQGNASLIALAVNRPACSHFSRYCFAIRMHANANSPEEGTSD